MFSQNYKQVKIKLESKNTLSDLIAAGMQFDHPSIDDNKNAIVFINEKDYEILRNSGVSFEVLIDDWKTHYDARTPLTEAEKDEFLRKSKETYGVEGFGFGSMGGFYTMEEVYAELDNMFSDYPEIITQRFSIGTTLENRDMWVVKISDNPNIDEDEPEIFYNSLIHSREPQGMMTLMYYMFYLLENYGTDPEVTYLVDNREIFFMPIFNVDGYEYNRTTDPNGGGMWRKNRRNNGGSYGVDLNRNFGYQWGYDDNGSSPFPSDETYRGTAGFSEPATMNVKLFCESREFNTGLNYHTYSNLLIIPWGYVTEETPDSLAFREFASDMTSWNNYEWGTAGDILYEVNGAADDWMYGEQSTKDKILSMTPEVGSFSDGFWPSQSRIFPLAEENLQPNLYLTWAAGDFVGTIAAEFYPEYVNPGGIAELAPVLRNKGLAPASNVTATLVAISPEINVMNSEISVSSIDSRQTVTPSERFEFSISEGAVIGEALQMAVITKSNGTVMSADTIDFIPGVPTILFSDQHDDPAVMWDMESSTSDDWDATTSVFYSAPTSYTESKSGNYSSYAETKMISSNTIDLTTVTSAVLSFRTKWAIEDSWDCGQVFISTNNGSSWNVLEGPHSQPGSGQGEQPTGEPVYDGTQAEWVLEEINLEDFIGEEVLVKFEFRSDSYIEKDGWYIDDIKIYYYGGGSGNMSCVDVEFDQGWNIMSVPVNPSSAMISGIFPLAETDAFYFDETYVGTEQLQPDLGYWIKFSDAGSVNVCGLETDNMVTLAQGWNMVGGNDTVHSVSALTTEPAGLIETPFFTFANGYNSVETLEPGKGYWVRTSGAGTLYLNGVSAGKSIELPENQLVITDAAGYRSTLYFAENFNMSAELPPLPPQGLFDARFRSGKFGESLSGSKQIKLQGYQLPVTVSSVNLDLVVNTTAGETIELKAGESISFNSLSGGILNISSVDADYDYNLAQNYPNPFNPETTIRFTLKERSNISLVLYNALGAEVGKIADGIYEAGSHEVRLNISTFNLSSGVYFYKLNAGEYTSVRKMILMK
ncbi:MAG: hypothetical protein SCALA702_38310 [Melioribacteraceae bacterium]|nr:MAG: hypothetical protein SCALA702_38310 [Melioribacteraceae bacterium]